jgi:uncharacterized protein with ParB-like and HNH nuclease domain
MTAVSSFQDINIEVCSLEDFFTNKDIFKVGIDTYQRPYFWDKTRLKNF